MAPRGRFRGLEESCQARFLLRRPRHQPRLLHLRPRHSPLVRSEGRSPELFYLSVRGDEWPAGEKSADPLFVSRRFVSPSCRGRPLTDLWVHHFESSYSNRIRPGMLRWLIRTRPILAIVIPLWPRYLEI